MDRAVRPALTLFHVLWLVGSAGVAWLAYDVWERIALAVVAFLIALVVLHVACVLVVTVWIVPRLAPGSRWDREVAAYLASVFSDTPQKPAGR